MKPAEPILTSNISKREFP